MGYTHYFPMYEKKKLSPKAEQQIKGVLQEFFQKGVISYGQDPVFSGKPYSEQEPLCNCIRICFNGATEEDLHEQFEWDWNFTRFAFCKTARKPYDLPVCIILCLLKADLGTAIRVYSDGDHEDWQEAFDYVKTLGLYPKFEEVYDVGYLQVDTREDK